MALFVCLEQLPARPLIFSIRFRSDVWPGQRDGRRLFRHAVPGVFLIRRVSCGLFCVPGTIACQTLWPRQRDGRRLFRHAVPGCFPDLKGVLWLGFCAWNSGSAGQTLDFFIRFRSDVWPGHRGGRRLFRHAVPGCFPDLKGVLWLVLCAWNNCLPDP